MRAVPRSFRFGVSPSSARAPWARGIAMAAANAGLDVTLTDASEEALDAGMAAIRKNYDISVSRGRLDRRQRG